MLGGSGGFRRDQDDRAAGHAVGGQRLAQSLDPGVAPVQLLVGQEQGGGVGPVALIDGERPDLTEPAGIIQTHHVVTKRG